ncbi:MAG: hypothetical protein FWJ87_12055 [Micromonosporaceae bacterium]
MAGGKRTVDVYHTRHTSSGLYLLTVIGAAVYFVGHADGFWHGVLGVLKAIVWPAFVVYRAMELMNL